MKWFDVDVRLNDNDDDDVVDDDDDDDDTMNVVMCRTFVCKPVPFSFMIHTERDQNRRLRFLWTQRSDRN